VRDGLLEILQETYGPSPGLCYSELKIEFFAFANVNNTFGCGRVAAGAVSDLLEGAPDTVLRAIAHILLAKMPPAD
jgi:hypothetical protein